MISTKMAGPPEAMELENRFVRLLGEAGTFELSGDALIIWNAGKGPPMRLVRSVK
jgi:heat shock protein HslJ